VGVRPFSSSVHQTEGRVHVDCLMGAGTSSLDPGAGIPFAKMLHSVNRDPTDRRGLCGSSFLLACALRLASPDASRPA
jgi:hypothetical protein